jgi:glycopeptide antibiotics resistance protein
VQIFKDKWNMMKKIMVILLSSILFETIQYAFAIGASDITDLIGNTMGGIIGIYLCMLLRKIVPKKCVSLINVLGIVVETTGVGLLLLLLLANM